jgi:tRNA-2-methylthio-N6-dimethylallyladenosine synthase
VQSGDDEILLRMNRRYTRHDYLKVIRKFHELMPDVSLSTDVIVGFCGETHEQFMNTYRLFEEVRFDMAYIAEYSPRPGTASHRLFQDDVPLKEKSKRFHILNDLLEQISTENHKNWIGKTVNVLVEKCENDICIGRTEHFRLLHFPGDSSMIGEILPVKVIDSTHWGLLGTYVLRSIETTIPQQP